MSETARPVQASWPKYALPRDTSLNGYRIERVLGSGGFGVTYLARDLLGQLFAIKEYFPRQFALREELSVVAASTEDTPLFEECRDRFLREAQALVHLGRRARMEDGIVRVQTYFEAYGTCFMVMDYVEGVSLASVLQTAPGELAADRVEELLAQLLCSLRIVHQAGLMHRDIKPANIILTDAGRAVLIDFGSSRESSTDLNTAYTQIYSGGYAPPEQMLGLPQGAFSDIYAIGAVCYQAVGGKVSDALLRQNMVSSGRSDPQPSAVSVGGERYPAQLLKAIDAALDVDPAVRPQNVDAMFAMFRPDAASERPAIAEVPREEAKAPDKSRSTVPIISAIAGAGALALAAAGYFIFLQRPAPPRTDVVVAAAPPPAPVAVTDTWDPSASPTGQQATDTTAVPPQASPPGANPVTTPLPEPPRDAVQEARIEHRLERIPVLERAREVVQELPCSVLTVKRGTDGLRVTGLAPPGQELDRLLVRLRAAGNPSDGITRVARSTCGAITTVGALVLQTWNSVPRTFAVQSPQREAVAGSPVQLNIDSVLPVLLVDVYREDGSVHHVDHPVRSSGSGKIQAEWVTEGVPGQRLIVAIASEKPLDLGSRPQTEPAAEYLEVLRSHLDSATTDVTADVLAITVK